MKKITKIILGILGGLGAASLALSASVFAPSQMGTGTPTNGYVLTSNGPTSFASWQVLPAGMVYPGAGIPTSTGSAWGTSITDNSANCNTAYGWGNHASAGYLTSVTAHNLLSTTHGDTTAGSVARGDIITGQGATPKWAKLTIGTNGKVLTSDGTDISWQTPSSGSPANPTASIGLTTVNGSLSTYMRSDAAPALDQSIFPNWTGQHIFTNNYLPVVDTSSLGTELVTNGGFTGNSNGWTLNSGWTYSSNSVSYGGSGGGSMYQQNLSTSFGRMYQVQYTVSNLTSGGLTVSLGEGSQIRTANGTYTEYLIAYGSYYTQLSFFSSPASSRFTIDNISVKLVNNGGSKLNYGTGLSYLGSTTFYVNHSNYQPGTTQIFDLVNGGQNTWINFKFGSTLKSVIGADNNGNMSINTTGSSGLLFYASIPSTYAYASIRPDGIIANSGFLGSQSGVSAGSSSAPTSMLYVNGGSAFKVKRITATQTLDNSATVWLCDGTNAAACTGSPTYACNHWNNSGNCTSNSSHGGCSWYGGSSCSDFNGEYGMGTCSGTSGCSADTYSCAGPTDQSTCEAQDDTYGGNCSWVNSGNCTVLGESACGSTMGCYQNYSYCSPNYSNCSDYQNQSGDGCSSTLSGCSSTSNSCSSYTDQGNCEAYGCYWNGGYSTCYEKCVGTYYTSCGPTNGVCEYQSENSCSSTQYFSGCIGSYYECSNNYYTGNCSGAYGASCTGTSSCTYFTGQSGCQAETGCAWSSVMNVNLPDGEQSPDRTYWIYNDATNGADTVIYPYTAQTIDKTTSLTLPAYKDKVQISYYKQTADCSGFGEGDCLSHSGCGANYDENNAFVSCSGLYATSKNWYVISN